MKKCLSFLVAILVMALCACGTPADHSVNSGDADVSAEPGQSDTGATWPVSEEMMTSDSPALAISVSINPEFELYLSLTNEILEVKAMNEDAEKLLAGKELFGKSYSDGIAEILAEATQQGYLNDRSRIKIVAREIIPGSFSANMETQILNAFKDYKIKTCMTFLYEITQEGDSLPRIMSTHTNTRDEFTEVICYDSDNNHIMTKLTFANGDYEEINYISATVTTSSMWYVDGRYSFWSNNDGLLQWYVLYPDGSMDWFQARYDATGQAYAWYHEIMADGSSREYYQENGYMIRDICVEADGSRIEYTMYDDGTNKTYDHIWPNGDYEHCTFYETGVIATQVSQINGSYTEIYYDEIGNITEVIDRSADGSTNHWDYENGQPVE